MDRSRPTSLRSLLDTPLGLRHRRLDDLIQVEARRLLTGRKFLERLQPFRRDRLRRNQEEGAIHHPFVVEKAFVAAFKRVRAEVIDLRYAHLRERLTPDRESLAALLK